MSSGPHLPWLLHKLRTCSASPLAPFGSAKTTSPWNEWLLLHRWNETYSNTSLPSGKLT